MKEALFYKRLNGDVECALCGHRCRISPENRGICGVRENRNGVLYTLVYELACASHIDPIEKKPFFHFLPGTTSFSLSTVGCNFSCPFCQNWTISHPPKIGEILGSNLSCEDIVRQAKKHRCKSISYTYTEPTVFFEYAFDTAKMAKEEGLYNNFVTNGYMSAEAIRMVAPYLDAANIDLKSINPDFYKRLCKAKLEVVLDSIKLMKDLGIWVEVTTLLILGENDSEEELFEIARFIKDVSENIPWHISRFHPDYKMTDRPPTPTELIDRAAEIGKEVGLRYVYSGNIPGDPKESTYCYSCGERLIGRFGFSIFENRLRDGTCYKCGTEIAGVYE
jgi:pyruvate formate lyase activating enzyme